MSIFLATDGGSCNNGKADGYASWAWVVADENALAAIREHVIVLLGKTAALTGAARTRVVEAFWNKIEADQPVGLRCGSGICAPGTNNMGELLGALHGFDGLGDIVGKNIVWYTDSKYTLSSIDVWSRKWTESELAERKNTEIICAARDKLDDLRRRKNTVLPMHVHSHQVMPGVVEDAVVWYLNRAVDGLCSVALKCHADGIKPKQQGDVVFSPIAQLIIHTMVGSDEIYRVLSGLTDDVGCAIDTMESGDVGLVVMFGVAVDDYRPSHPAWWSRVDRTVFNSWVRCVVVQKN